ncbi:type II secretion system protein [Nakamurella sp. GG22]
MITAVLVGAALGGALFALLLRLAPPATAPLVQLALFDARHGAAPTQAHGPATTGPVGGGLLGRVQVRSGRWLFRQLTRRGISYTSLRQDLALTGRTFEDALGRKITLAGAGLLLGLFASVGLGVAGVALPAGAPVVLGVVLAVVFFFLPDLDARADAARRREEFRRALGAYLDLVALEMAGSAAPAEALPSAARIGAGWPLALIRDTLYRATRGGRNPWTALADLGQRIGVGELRDLGQLIALVAHDGARVRSTLTARAQTMRRHELANLEGKAGKADQSMRIAQILIGLGFIAFLGYPAVVAVLSF